MGVFLDGHARSSRDNGFPRTTTARHSENKVQIIVKNMQLQVEPQPQPRNEKNISIHVCTRSIVADNPTLTSSDLTTAPTTNIR